MKFCWKEHDVFFEPWRPFFKHIFPHLRSQHDERNQYQQNQMASFISTVFHDIDAASSMGLNDTTGCRTFGHFVRRVKAALVELLLHCELVRTHAGKNPAA
jgi:hypothetical protein